MATTATISIGSDIYSGFSGISKTMTLTKAGALTDIEETTGFSRRKLTGTTAVDLVIMADASLIQETVDHAANHATKAAHKVYIRNIGDGRGNIDKSIHVAVGLGTVGDAGTTADYQEIAKLYGGDWMLIPLTGIDATGDIQVTAETDDAVVLEYVMFYEV
tara:strand:+ start:219 stop:701 length:483 start_codon:yes stop_codon:yes gene_type:complete